MGDSMADCCRLGEKNLVRARNATDNQDAVSYTSEALQHYESALKMPNKPGQNGEDMHPEIYAGQAECYLINHNYPKAQMKADQAIRTNSEYARGHIIKAKALEGQNKAEDAKSSWEKAHSLTPEDPDVVKAMSAQEGTAKDDVQKTNINAAVAADPTPKPASTPPPNKDDHAQRQREMELISTAIQEKDYYAILSVDKHATNDEIKRAYRKAARRWHPDRNLGVEGSTEIMNAVNDAGRNLTNAVRRRAYDKFGEYGLKLVDEQGEEQYEKLEPQLECMQKYQCCCLMLCCFTVLVTGCCFCCCCFCCCCAPCRKGPPEEQEMPDMGSDSDEEDHHQQAPGQRE